MPTKLKWRKIDGWQAVDWLIFRVFPAISLFFISSNQNIMYLITQENQFIGVGVIIGCVVLTCQPTTKLST